MTEINIFDSFGSFAEDKRKAKEIREKIMTPKIKNGEVIILNFENIEGATQSFIHALISALIRNFGEEVLEKISFKNCNTNVQTIIEIVCQYMQDSILDIEEDVLETKIEGRALPNNKNEIIMNVEPIINARFKRFRESFGFNRIPDGEAFERFVNHAIFTSHQPDAFSADNELLDKICVGGNDDMGIDGLGVKINGLLIRDIQDVKDILAKSKRADVEMIFVQSKYKPYFDKGELNNFIDGVRDFLSEKHRMPMNEKIKEFIEIKNYLLNEEVVVIWDRNPLVRLYYVAMGTWKDSPHQLALVEQLKEDIDGLKIYDRVEIHFIDRDALKSICDNNENTFTTTISAIDTMPLTDVDGVTDSCIALCMANEFAKILTTDEGLIRKSLFDDNVRDYQGMNTINKEIEKTINEEPSKFILLNNGITIVCDEYIQNNRRLTIKNPQIVNGCQTSHVIFFASKSGMDISKVPLNIKIISTEDLEVSNQIVRGTNRQNIVLDEAFETTKKFHKDLEDFVNAFSPEYGKIYYERRSKQFNHNPTIQQTEKFNLRILVQYFIGMYLNKPHEAHRHESKLLHEYANIIFQEHQSKLPYFTSVLTFLKLENLFRNDFLDKRELYAFRPHLTAAFRESIGGRCPSINNEIAIDQHSQLILKILKSEELTKKQFTEVVTVFRRVKDIWVSELHKAVHGMKDVSEFTELLISEIDKYFKPKSQDISKNENERYFGRVKRVIKGIYGTYYGFIERQPEDIFFHSKWVRGLDFNSLEGKLVSYKISTNPKDSRNLATDIEIVN